MKGKKKKLIPNSTIEKEVQELRAIPNLTPFRSKESINVEHKGVKRKLFTEENRKFRYCVAIVLPFLAVGIYAMCALLGYDTNFDLFVATGIFVAVALLCFCSIKLIAGNSKGKSDNMEEEKKARTFSNIELKVQGVHGLGEKRSHTI